MKKTNCKHSKEDEEEILMREILSDREMRVAYFEHNFFAFCFYYFPQFFDFETPDYLWKYYSSLEAGRNVFFNGFRGCSKTTPAQLYVVWCIVYKKKRNIMWYSYSTEDAARNIGYITNILIGNGEYDDFTQDFGQLYFDESDKPRKGKKKKKKTMGDFVTENQVYVRAVSLNVSPRGSNYMADDGKHRPDLLIFDDVDTLKGVSSKKVIDKNRRFIKDEVLGGVTGFTQIVFLGNTINDDGIVPRVRQSVSGDAKYDCFVVPIYDEEGHIQWSRFVETVEEADILNEGITDVRKMYVPIEYERERLGPTSFGQNYLLKPYVDGSTIIKRHWVSYLWDLERDHTCHTCIAVDPAFSEKTKSDPIGIAVTTSKKVGGLRHKYLWEALEIKGEDKTEEVTYKILIDLHRKYTSDRFIIEGNNGGELLARGLRAYALKMGIDIVVEVIYTSTDKVLKLRNHETKFSQGLVHFHPNVSKVFEEQLFAFPNVDHDDMVDAMGTSFENKSDAMETVRSAQSILERIRQSKSENNNGYLGRSSHIPSKF